MNAVTDRDSEVRLQTQLVGHRLKHQSECEARPSAKEQDDESSGQDEPAVANSWQYLLRANGRVRL